jgi:pyruvate,water dikinase
VSATALASLHELGPVATCGQKAFNLARLLRLGYRVPGSVVLLGSALEAHIAQAGARAMASELERDLTALGPQELRRRAKVLRTAIAATPLDTTLAAELAARHAERWQGMRLAVRSSAVGEDSANASFAGQLDSFLGVDSLEALHAAIAATWASRWNDRCLLYQRHRGARLQGMAVIVQEQVDAIVSGVLFSRGPATPANEHASTRRANRMLVECCTGLGQSLVSGEIDPLRLAIDRRTFALDAVPSDTEAALLSTVRDHEASLRALAQAALVLELELQAPVDIEWSIGRDGALHFLQVRPITTAVATADATISRPHAYRTAGEATVVWSNANIAENFPAPVSPLLYSIAARGYAAYFRNLGKGFGLARRRIAAMSLELDHVVGVHGARLYYNLTNIHRLLALAPGGRWLSRFFNDFTGARGGELDPSSLPPLSAIERIIEALRVPLCVAWQYAFVGRRVARFERTVDAYCDPLAAAPLREWALDRLHRALREFMTVRLERWNNAALADTAAMVCYGLLRVLVRRALPDRDPSALHNTLLKGLPDLASNRPVIALWTLSRAIRQDATLCALFAEHAPAAILETLALPAHSAFATRFRRYLDEHGYRCSGELMLTVPHPAEDPVQIVALLKAYAARDEQSPLDRIEAQAREREALTRETLDRLTPNALLRSAPLLTRGSRLRLVLRATHGAIALRERARTKQARLYAQLRQVALAIGDRLFHTGTLAAREDVFFLTVDELDRLLAGTEMFASDMHTLVRTRRAQHAKLGRLTLPDTLRLAPGEYVEDASATQEVSDASTNTAAGDDGSLAGEGACGGRVEGSAIVLDDAAQAHRINGEAILVTRQTDPGWAGAFFLVRGLVVERGGMLSHGAIIAREYGIPAVVGVRDATRRIATGQRVRVDGDRGRVEPLGGRGAL